MPELLFKFLKTFEVLTNWLVVAGIFCTFGITMTWVTEDFHRHTFVISGWLMIVALKLVSRCHTGALCCDKGLCTVRLTHFGFTGNTCHRLSQPPICVPLRWRGWIHSDNLQSRFGFVWKFTIIIHTCGVAVYHHLIIKQPLCSEGFKWVLG